MNAKTEEAIELSNAAARLLSQGDANLPNSARDLAELMLRKALTLLEDEKPSIVTASTHGNIRAALVLLGVDEQTILGLGCQKSIRVTIKASGDITIQ